MSLLSLGVTGTETSEPLDLSTLSPGVWLDAALGRTAKGATKTLKTSVQYWKQDSAGALEPAMGTAFTTSILIYPNTGGAAGNGTLVDLRDTSENKGYVLYVRSDNGYVVFAMQGNKVTPGAIQQIFTGGAWGLYAGKYDPALASGAGSLLVSKNGAAFGNGINTITQQNPTSPKFRVGAFGGSEASGNCLDAQVAQVCIWHKAVSDAEISALWNGGAGLKYEDFTAGLLANLAECFEFNGVTGDFVGRVSGMTLSPVNAPSFDDGLHDTTARDLSIIRQLADQSGNARNASQTTATERPYLHQVSPSRLVFAGGQRLVTPALDLGSQFSLYVVGKVNAVGTVQSFGGHIDVGNHFRLSVNAAGNVEAVVHGGGGAQTVTVTPGSAMTNLAVLGLRCDGTNVNVSHNNTKAAGTISGGFNTSASRTLYIGDHAASGNPLSGEIYEWLWLPTARTDGMHNLIVASLADKYGITL